MKWPQARIAAECDILLFGWFRLIERPSSETFDRIEEPTSDPHNYEMQPSCEKLIKQLQRL